MLPYQRKLGDYLLGKKLGSGQFSKVREAYRGPNRYAAKYVPKTSDAAANESHVTCLFNEAKIMSKLDHPNIMKLYDYNDKGVIEKANGNKVPVLYLIFELITGGELFDYVAVGGRFSDKLARHYFRQLIEALEFMHAKGYAHRDIKAENLLLDGNYGLKLADFGFSVPMSGKDGSGKLHTYKGTLGYMAPELHAGQAYSGEKVDLFAVGVLLFIMVAQHPPFRKAVSQDGFYKLFTQQNETYWAKVAAGKPPETFSPHLRSLINSLLAFNPALRPSIAEIKSHPWYNGPLVTPEELKAEFTARRAKVEVDWKKKAAAALAKKALERTARAQQRATAGGFAPHATTGSRGCTSESSGVVASVKKLLPLYKVPSARDSQPSVFEQIVFFTVEEPEAVMDTVREYFEDQKCSVVDDEKKYKMQATFSIFEEKLVVNSRLEKVEEGVYCVKLEKISGSKMDFLETYGEVT